MDPTTIIADRLASLDDARGHHHIACELLAALEAEGWELTHVPSAADISDALLSPFDVVAWRPA